MLSVVSCAGVVLLCWPEEMTYSMRKKTREKRRKEQQLDPCRMTTAARSLQDDRSLPR